MHVGLDIDDKAFHGTGLIKSTGEIFEFKCKSNFGSLKKHLLRFKAQGYKVDACYEASYLGFPLCRQLRDAGFKANIIAPSLIPETRGRRVKTDRLDSARLARQYSIGELTPIYIPAEVDQEARDFLRIRKNFVDKRKKNRQEILSLCRCYDINYKQSEFVENYKKKLEDKRKTKLSKTYQVEYWTNMHYDWLNAQIGHLGAVARTSIEMLLQLDAVFEKTLKECEGHLNDLAENPRYIEFVLALCALKGIEKLTALTMITEIGDIRRFSHPKKLVSYLGMDIIEYSSGGKEKKFGITKMGNKRIRTALVESCQSLDKGAITSKHLQKRRGKVVSEIVDIAIKCQLRLRKRWLTLTMREKHRNKAKMACARELATFVWEMLMEVEKRKARNLKIAV